MPAKTHPLQILRKPDQTATRTEIAMQYLVYGIGASFNAFVVTVSFTLLMGSPLVEAFILGVVFIAGLGAFAYMAWKNAYEKRRLVEEREKETKVVADGA